TLLLSSLSFSQIVINEIDSDQTGTDNAEFIELKSDNPNMVLDGYVVVLFNGSNDESYGAYDLDGYTTDSNGFFILGNGSVPGIDINLAALQNGEDAVAIYQDDATNFSDGTLATNNNLIDAIVYETGNDSNSGLLSALGETIVYDEDANGNKDTESIQRAQDGTYCVGAPTPNAVNINCSNICPLNVSVTSVVCDNSTTGTDTYTVTGTFQGGGTETYTFNINAGTITSTDDPDTMTSGTIVVTGIPEETDFTYTITSATCNITNTITSPECEPSINVNSIADLRAGTLGDTYTLTGEAVLTYQQNNRNQKYIEDATAAILIDDNSGNITTTYNVGDGITGITGELTSFNGILQFVPESDPGAPTSTGLAVTPQVITIADFLANYEDYESEMIAFANVSFLEADGSTTFNTSTNYTLSNGSEQTTMRTNFWDETYIGEVIPSGAINVIGLGAQYDNGTDPVLPQIFATNVDATLAADNFTASAFTLYPNPTSNGAVAIQTETSGAVNVEIYNLLGKRALTAKNVNGNLNVSTLNAGVYLVKVTQNGVSSTKKLIVK
ncbi:T9SS type A sorting domain-containing protein, partial [Mesonia mobilis]|uniref:T9SS type A sorting domain-containing protein n=1 Tax=Mesonia mobilis TaxID=369791 RepID=UPI0026F132D4